MSLYLKYRPRNVEELDLASVRESLHSIIKANEVSHAYLLTGPRGAGKTSSARILARMVNCEKNKKKLGEPCNECDSCLNILNGSSMDYIEIDAASNRGIDDIRELKEKIRLAPSELTYKVYVIDEVHMLTTEAFNALLKTLEEPPKHVLFILCTTETHKVPETIISRCVRIQFSKATPEEMKRSFARVVKGEGKKVQDAALEYLARSVDGSFRDGVKVLEQVLAKADAVDLAMMEEAVVGASGYGPNKMIEALVSKDVSAALSTFHADMERGVDLVYLLVAVMKGLRDKLLAGGERELTRLVFMLDDAARKVTTSPVPELLVEMVVIEWCGGIPENSENPARNATHSVAGGSDNQKTQKVRQSENSESQNTRKAREPEKSESQKRESNGNHKEVWQKLMAGLNGDSITMGALLSKATPAEISGDLLTIHVGYGFHRDQIMSEKVLAKLEKLVSEVVGRQMRVQCEVSAGKHVSPPAHEATDGRSDTIDEAMAIFA